MQPSVKIATNSAILFLSKVIAGIGALLASVVVVRYLEAKGYGQYSIVFAYLSFFQILTGLGIDTIVIKELSINHLNRERLVGNAILMKLAFSLLAVITACIIAQFMGYSHEIRLLIYMASLSMLFSFNSLYVGILQVNFKAMYYAVPELVVSLISSCVMILLALFKYSLGYFVFAQAATIIPLTFFYRYYAHHATGFKPSYSIDFNIWKSLLLDSWPIFFSSVFITINMRIDQVMLYDMLGANSLGLYSALVRIVESLNIIPSLFMVSVYPMLCSNFAKSPATFSKICGYSFKYMSILIIPGSIMAFLLSKQILSTLYGNSFADASSAFSILMFSEIFVFLGVVNGSIFYASGLQKILLIFPILGALSNIAFNIILIPRYGIAGASLSTLLSYSIGIPLQYYITDTRQITRDYLRSMIKPLISSIPMVLFVYYCSSYNFIFLIFVSIPLVFIPLILTKCLGKEDLLYLREIISFAKKKDPR